MVRRGHAYVLVALFVGAACKAFGAGDVGDDEPPSDDAGSSGADVRAEPSDAATLPDVDISRPLDSGTPAPVLGSPSQRYVATIEAEQPLAYWRCNERAGNSALADSVNGHHAVLSNPSPTLGLQGIFASNDSGSIKFDGTTGMLASSPNVPFRAGDAFTVELWFKPEQRPNDGDFRSIVTQSKTGEDALGLYFIRERLEAETFSVSGKTWVATTEPVLNQWHHLVFTRAGTDYALYVDGVRFNATQTEATATSNVNVNFTIGAKTLSRPSVHGSVAEVAFYDRALLPERVRVHNLLGRAPFDAGTQ